MRKTIAPLALLLVAAAAGTAFAQKSSTEAIDA